MNLLVYRLTRWPRRRLAVYGAVVLFVIFCCVCPLVFGLADMTIRRVGILPTYTPGPPRTATPLHTLSPTPRRSDPVDLTSTPVLTLGDVMKACQACNAFVKQELLAPDTAEFRDCQDAQFEVFPDRPQAVRIMSQVLAQDQIGAQVRVGTMCDIVQGDGGWQLDKIWFEVDGKWQLDKPGVVGE